MCELLGLSSNKKIGIEKIYSEFKSHANVHKDGWGIAFYNTGTFTIIKESKQANYSLLAEFLAKYVKSHMIIAHIRRKSHGHINLKNTHPFERELFGKDWIFAHNGTVFERPELRNFKLNHYFPIGKTDSELAFCYILDKLKENDRNLIFNQKIECIITSINKIDVGSFGFNFLMSDSEYLYVYRGKRGPTLHYIDLFSENSDKTVIFSTRKLVNSDILGKWILIRRGQLLIVKDGEFIYDLKLDRE